MTNFVQNAARNEKGFTLVELAVVMIIVGLLIGGILKGQEMIANAQVTSTVAQAKAFDAAVSTFREQFQGMPGDIATPETRLPNCANATVCGRAGNGDQKIGNDPGAAHASLGNENGAAWTQLAAADLITGIDFSADPGDKPAPGISIPQANISGSAWQIGYVAQNTTLTSQTGAELPRGGHYILIDNSNEVASDETTASLTPSQAARIDTKLDDGSPNTGSAMAMGGAPGGDTCVSADTALGVYNEALTGQLCGLYIRVQG